MSVEMVRLGDVVSISRRTVEPSRIREGELYVGLENVNSLGHFEDVQGVATGELGSNKFLFEAGNILFGKLRPYLRKIAIPDFDGICSTDIIPLIANETFVDRRYLLYFLRADTTISLATARSSGANLPRLSPKVLLDFIIPLPSLERQREIAAVLDKVDELRAKRRQSISKLEGLLQSTFLEMFGDPIENPKGWEVRKLGEISESRLGKMLDAKRQTELNQKLYLRNSNVQWDYLDMDDLKVMGFSDDDLRTFKLERGDLLVCEGGEVGRAAIWKGELEDCYFQKAIHRVRFAKTTILPQYGLFYFWRMAQNGGLNDYSTSATIAHLTGVQLKKLPVPIPDLELQERFAEIYAAYHRQKDGAALHVHQLDTLYSSLQAQFFGAGA